MTGFYISDVGVILVVVCALVTAILGWILSSRVTARLAYRACVAAGAVAVTIAAMTWDVVLTSVKMAELCPQAGVRVKKSVRVEGFYIRYGSPDLLDRGFKFIETKGIGDRVVVYSKDGDAVKREEFNANEYQIKSRFEFIAEGETPFEGRKDIGIRKFIVRDRETKEELGYAVQFAAFPGWVDRKTVSLLALFIWMCPEHGFLSLDLLNQTLLPL